MNMADVVAPPLDLDGNAVTAQVVEFIGGITLGAIQSLGEAIDRCAVDEDDDSVFYDAAEGPQEPKSTPPDLVGAFCEEMTQATGGEAEKPCSLCCDADSSPEQQEHMARKELPNSLHDTEPPTQPLSQEQEEADRPPSDDRESESSSGPESAESTQLLLGAETEMLGQPQSQSCELVSPGNDTRGESLRLISAESTQPERENEKLLETQRIDDDESRRPELEESAESSSLKIQNDNCTRSLVTEGEECSGTNVESLNKVSKEPIQSTCIENGESLKYCCDAQESTQNFKSENDTSVKSVCIESGETIQPLCDHKASEAPLCVANEELAPSSCLESRQSTLSGSISDGEGLKPSQTQGGQSACEASGQPDDSAGQHAAATSSMDVCDQSSTNQQETEEPTAVSDHGIGPIELPHQPVCEVPGQPDNSASLPEAASCPCTEPATDGTTATLVANATSTDACDANLTDQRGIETVVPDDNVGNAELPDESVCKVLAQPDSSQSLPEGLYSQLETDSAGAAPVTTATSSIDVCDSSPNNQTEEIAAPDDGARPAELLDQSVCEGLAQPDNFNSLPEVASSPNVQPETDISATAATVVTTATSSLDVCNTSPTNQLETKETAVPDDSACPAELPGKHDNVTTEGELSGSLRELHSTSTEPQRLISKETQTEILEEATAMSQLKLQQQEETDQEKATAVEGKAKDKNIVKLGLWGALP